MSPKPFNISFYSNNIFPDDGRNLDVIILNVVDLPAPFGPKRPKI